MPNGELVRLVAFPLAPKRPGAICSFSFSFILMVTVGTVTCVTASRLDWTTHK